MSGVPQEGRGKNVCEGKKAVCVHTPQTERRWVGPEHIA